MASGRNIRTYFEGTWHDGDALVVVVERWVGLGFGRQAAAPAVVQRRWRTYDDRSAHFFFRVVGDQPKGLVWLFPPVMKSVRRQEGSRLALFCWP